MSLSTSQLLVRAGFTRQEGVAYAALTELSSASISDICRASKLHRPTVYRAIAALSKAGLIFTTAKGKRALYSANATTLKKILRRAEQENESAWQQIVKNIPVVSGDLQELNGPEGLRAVLDDLVKTLNKGDMFYRYSSRAPRGDVEKYIPANYREMLKQKKIEQFVITNEALRKRPHKNRMECASKFIPAVEDMFEHDVNVLIYANKVAVVDFGLERAYIVTNQHFAQLQMSIFKMLFTRL